MITSTFYGTSSVHLTDGETSIFVDAFLTRPSLARLVVGRLRPSDSEIDAALGRGGVDKLDALFVAHSHYDHLMDAPAVVKKVGGTMYGSESTLNYGRGEGLADSQMALIADGDDIAVGAFTVRVIEAPHSPGNIAPGFIRDRLSSPCHTLKFKDGGCFVFHFSHPEGNRLVLPIANYIPGFLDGLKARVVYLGIGALGRQSDDFRSEYWRHTVEQLEPELVIPVHWDHFGHSLSKPLKPLPVPADNVAKSREFLAAQDANVHFPVAFESVRLTPEGAVVQ